MFAKTGKFTALLMAALMVATPLTEVAVFADELETTQEEGIVTEEVLAEETSEAGDSITEDDLIADDQTEVVDDREEVTDDAEYSDGLSSEEYIDDLDPDQKAPDAPKTSGKVMRFGTSGLQKDQHIYMGNLDGDTYRFQNEGSDKKPYWRILDDKKANNGKEGYVFVMSEALWGRKTDTGGNGQIEFSNKKNDGQKRQNDWQFSDAQKWCQAFLVKTFWDKDREVITGLSKKDDARTGGWGESELKANYDQVFFLSVQELCDYVIDVDPTTISSWRQAYYVGKNGHGIWWLRSPSTSDDAKAAAINGNGQLIAKPDAEYGCARPAFNIDTSKILFSEDAKANKESGPIGPGALSAVKTSEDITDWVFTIIDSDWSGFSASRVDSGKVKAGNNIKIKYSGAQATNTSQYVSAVLCDADEKDILYYGRLVSQKDAGETEVTIPAGLPDGTYKLKVFSEEYNEGKETDYASKPSVITIEVGKLDQTITASDQTKKIGDAAFNLNAKTDGDGKLSYESSDTNVVTVDKNGLVTIKGVGTATITITASETEKYKAATKTVKITVTAKQKAEQKITASDQTKTVGDDPFDLNAKTSGDGKLSYKSGDKKVVTVDEDGYVTITGTGTTTITITASETDNYKAATKVINIIIKAKVVPGKIDIGSAKITGVKSKTYTGKKIKQNPTVKLGGKTLKRGKDYAVKYTSDRVNAGKVTILINGMGDYTGSVLKTFKIKKAAITVKGKTVNVGASTIKGKGRTIKANKFFKISKNEGEVTYKKTKGLQKITVAKNGDVTLKPGIKKGPHEVKVKVTAAGDKNHKKTIKTVKITVMIK